MALAAARTARRRESASPDRPRTIGGKVGICSYDPDHVERGVMRVWRVSIASWRNLRDVQLEVPDEAAVVCLVGENGTAKSTVLELLSAAAHQLGISQGVEISRGNPLEEPHEIEIVVQIPLADLAMPTGIADQLRQHDEQWTGQLLFTSTRRATGESSTVVSAAEVRAEAKMRLGPPAPWQVRPDLAHDLRGAGGAGP